CTILLTIGCLPSRHGTPAAGNGTAGTSVWSCHNYKELAVGEPVLAERSWEVLARGPAALAFRRRKRDIVLDAAAAGKISAEPGPSAGHPFEGDTDSKRRGEMKSQHQGKYWIGGYERKGDRAQGTLTSVPFTVTHPWCSFLVGGGFHETTCVEIVLKNGDIPLARVSGANVAPNEGQENLYRVAVDLSGTVGRDAYVRLVDRHSGHWGHINFDDFRFHSAKPNLPPRPGFTSPGKPDDYKFAGLPPDKAAAAMTV